jgi:hypothetical protein
MQIATSKDHFTPVRAKESSDHVMLQAQGWDKIVQLHSKPKFWLLWHPETSIPEAAAAAAIEL